MTARWGWALLSGVLFAAGLVVSGMTQPHKVAAFLDVAGAWDPTLLGVMAAALAVDALAFKVILKRGAPLLDSVFHLPTQHRVDAKLVAGAAIFGTGWGLSGVCPGPAVVGLVSLQPATLTFAGCMLVGMAGYRVWEARRVDAQQKSHTSTGPLQVVSGASSTNRKPAGKLSPNRRVLSS